MSDGKTLNASIARAKHVTSSSDQLLGPMSGTFGRLVRELVHTYLSQGLQRNEIDEATYNRCQDLIEVTKMIGVGWSEADYLDTMKGVVNFSLRQAGVEEDDGPHADCFMFDLARIIACWGGEWNETMTCPWKPNPLCKATNLDIRKRESRAKFEALHRRAGFTPEKTKRARIDDPVTEELGFKDSLLRELKRLTQWDDEGFMDFIKRIYIEGVLLKRMYPQLMTDEEISDAQKIALVGVNRRYLPYLREIWQRKVMLRMNRPSFMQIVSLADVVNSFFEKYPPRQQNRN